MATPSYVPVTPGTGANVDVVQLVNSSSQTIFRQVVVIGDPNDASKLLAVDNTNGIPVQIKQFPSGVSIVSTFTGWLKKNFTNLVAGAQDVKTTPGTLGGYFLNNPNTSAVTVQIFDLATAPTVGTTAPDLTLTIPANASANMEFTKGITFTNGIKVAATTTTTGNTAPTTPLNGFFLFS